MEQLNAQNLVEGFSLIGYLMVGCTFVLFATNIAMLVYLSKIRDELKALKK